MDFTPAPPLQEDPTPTESSPIEGSTSPEGQWSSESAPAEVLAPTPFWKSKKFIIAVVGIVVVSSVGVVAAALWMNRSLAPEVVLAKTFAEMNKIESMTQVLSVSAKVSGEKQLGIESVTIRSEGTVDLKNSSSPKQQMNAAMAVGISSESPVQALGISSLSLALEERSVDPLVSYIQFTKLPNLGIFSLSPFENKWMKVDQSQLSSTPLKAFDVQTIVQIFKKTFSSQEVLAGVDDRGSESIDGNKAYHYVVRLNLQRVVQGLKELVRATKTTLTLQEETQLYDAVSGALANASIDIWIDTLDFRLVRLQMPLQSTNNGVTVNGTLQLALSEFNKSVTISIPSDARPLGEIVGDVFKAFGASGATTLPGGAPFAMPGVSTGSGPDTDFDGLTDSQERAIKTNPASADTDNDGLIDGDEVNKYHTDPLKVDTDGDGLTDGEEVLRWHTDPLKSDTDGDGYNDGQEVHNGYNPLGPGKLTPSQLQLPR